jgi:hypothetical protein
LQATRRGSCGCSTPDTDRLLVTYGTSGANWAAIITNNTPANKYGEHYSCRHHSERSTTRHCVVIHFHRLPNL